MYGPARTKQKQGLGAITYYTTPTSMYSVPVGSSLLNSLIVLYGLYGVDVNRNIPD